MREDWLPRLYRIRGEQTQSIDEWARGVFPDFDPDRPAALYGPLMKELFPLADERQRETERLCDGRAPAFGYAVLAALMSRPDGIFSAALTTNFDDLIADAMYVFGDRRPLVIQHEALAGFVRPGRVQRPLVVKVHGDHRLNPMHTDVETARLEQGISEGIRGLLHDRGVIFNGYAGDDLGVIKTLSGLPPKAIPLGVWWVSRAEPKSAIRDWLLERDAIWVEAAGFDELMLLFRQEFEIEHPTARKFQEMIEGYMGTYERLEERVDELPDSDPDSAPLKAASKSARASAPEWWKIDLEAAQHRDSDPDKADQIYREGTERLEDARLLNNYAIFLAQVKKDKERAEELYERAVKADPEYAKALGNFAWFVSAERKDPDRAEGLFERAIAADPEEPHALCNFAVFCWDELGDPNRAEDLYDRSLAASPDDSATLRSYAIFQSSKRRDQDRAEELYERALAVDPEYAPGLGAYAAFRSTVRNDQDRAEELYERALAADPGNAENLRSFAIFWSDVRRDQDRAEELYERALAAEPDHVRTLTAYASFRSTVRKDPDRAEELYEQALAADSKRVEALFGYAIFISDARGDHDRAEELYEEALAVAPENAPAIGAFGLFSKKVRKDYDRAEELYERALAADPYETDTLSNAAILQADIRRDPERAKALCERVLQVNANHANALGTYGRLLLEEGDDEEGWNAVEKAFEAAVDDQLLLELWFYVLVLGGPDREGQAISEVKRLVTAGVRSPDWNFAQILERARTEGRAEIGYLEKAADVIAAGLSPNALNGWDRWSEAPET